MNDAIVMIIGVVLWGGMLSYCALDGWTRQMASTVVTTKNPIRRLVIVSVKVPVVDSRDHLAQLLGAKRLFQGIQETRLDC